MIAPPKIKAERILFLVKLTVYEFNLSSCSFFLSFSLSSSDLFSYSYFSFLLFLSVFEAVFCLVSVLLSFSLSI